MSTTPTRRRPHDDLLLSLTITQSICDGVVIGDYAGRVCLINPAAARLLNLDPNQFLGASMADMPGVGPEGLAGGERRSITVGGRAVEVERVEVRPADEGETWISSVLIYHDTGSAQVAQTLHELRTCLAALRASVDMLALDALGPLTGEQRELLAIARGSNAGALDLLGRLRDQLRPAADAARAQPPAPEQVHRAREVAQ